MRNIVLIVAVFLLLCCNSKKEKEICEYSVKIHEYGFFEKFAYAPDTIVSQNTQNSYVKFYLNSCKGSMFIEGYENEKKILEGIYIEAIELSEEIGVTLTIEPNLEETKTKEIFRYYDPIKDGEWKYWDKEGKLIKEEIWDKGELKETKEY